MVVVLATSTPVPAAAPDPAAPLLSKVAETRRALTTGSLTDAVAATARLAGIDSPVSPDGGTDAVDLPHGLAGPVGRLSGAIREATDIARSAVRAPVDRGRAVAAALRGDLRRGLPPRFADAVDLAEMQRAATLVTRALDRAIPQLQAAAPLPPTAAKVQGCDLVDQAPWLCVGGIGDNIITSDYALVVDLGGDDEHLHAAGGADALGNTMPVSVTLDLAGADRYEATVREDAGPIAVLGSSFLGVGMLVDVTGDDTYIAQSSDAQFYAAASSLLGVGMLADLDGNDDYRVTTTRPVGAGVSGLGTAFAGLSTFHDRSGDDAYVVESRPALGYDFRGQITGGVAVAQGMGLHTAAGGHVGPITIGVASASAVFADDAGNDTMTIAAISASVPPDDWQPSTPGAAVVAGGGVGSQPHGSLALTGPGESSWSLVAETDSDRSPARVVGFGHGVSGGFGILSDAGGDDDYLAAARASSTRSLTIDDACECAGAAALGGAASAVTHGAGEGFTGVLDEAGGDDSYVAEVTSAASIDVRDERSEGGDGVVGGAVGGAADVVAQGAANDIGTGLLLDSGGDDRYDASARSDAQATATAIDPDRVTETFAVTGPAGTAAQGAATAGSRATLQDVGGTDTYLARAGTNAAADPPATVQAGAEATLAQAAVDGGSHAVFSDADGGLSDAFVSDPPRPPCEGSRGSGVWQDCGSDLGLGFND